MRYRNLLTFAVLLSVVFASVEGIGLPCVDFWSKWCGRKQPRSGKHKRFESSSTTNSKDVLLPLVRDAIKKILLEKLQKDDFIDEPLPLETDKGGRDRTYDWQL